MRTLVLGGARSGKSIHAEALVMPATTVDYVATSAVDPEDAEWVERIALHQARRPAHWRTIETADVAEVLGRDDEAVVLVDCLGVWLTRAMDECGIWDENPSTSSGNEDPSASTVTTPASTITTPAEPVEAPVVTDFRALPGWGARAVVDGKECVVGRIDAAGAHKDDAWAASAIEAAERTGAVAVAVRLDGRLVGVVTMADQVKPSAAAAIEKLTEMGLRTVLLTGDSELVARHVAEQLGITEVRARVLPDEKSAAIDALREEGRIVAMVGDGINDSAALATANLGIALGQGTDIAMKSADIIIVRDDLRTVVDAVALSRKTIRTIRINLVWAFGYNIAAIPIAAAGLLNPLIAAAAMAMSSVLVVSNSLRLRTYEPVE